MWRRAQCLGTLSAALGNRLLSFGAKAKTVCWGGLLPWETEEKIQTRIDGFLMDTGAKPDRTSIILGL